MTRHRLWIAARLLFVVALVAFLGYALRDSWADAGPRLRDADPVDLAIAFVLLAIYYLLFVVGWQWILRALRCACRTRRAPVRDGVDAREVRARWIWTPAARVVWLKKSGTDAATPVIVSSILLEAGLRRLRRARLRGGPGDRR